MEDHIELPELVEQTANMLRGMTMDPAIPAHAKEAMWARIRTLDSAVEHAMSVDAEAVGWAYGKCVALGLENGSQESAMMMDLSLIPILRCRRRLRCRARWSPY